ncbi:MAG: hypothetical protein IJ300_00120 [Clostridia bacterium]|nr:hypothetical protein [Clostridia bacterium]
MSFERISLAKRFIPMIITGIKLHLFFTSSTITAMEKYLTEMFSNMTNTIIKPSI